jgi:prepilin-type N-terminal cleavage/methylation domain-containing protein
VPNSRRGFSIIELMLVISIVGTLLSLIVPAVQKVRESDRLLTCKSRLRQVGVAIHGYVAVHRGLPPISVGIDGQRDRAADNASPHVSLLPWLEQTAVAQRISRFRPLPMAADSGGVGDKRLQRLVSKPIPVFRCPSDSGPGRNNMVFCLGADPVAVVEPRSGFWGLGPFPLIESLPLAQVHDGLSNTAAVSERLTGSQDDNSFDPKRDFWYSGVQTLLYSTSRWPIRGDELVSICDAAIPSAPFVNTQSGWSWAYGRYDGACYNHVVTPNSNHNNCATMARSIVPRSTLHGIFRATSGHTDGVNQLMLDGSLRFISNHVDATVYSAIATRSGGEPIGAMEF